MSSPKVNAPKRRKIRIVRANGRIIEIREFDPEAKINSVCHVTVIKRESSTNQILGTYHRVDRVTQQDLLDTAD